MSKLAKVRKQVLRFRWKLQLKSILKFVIIINTPQITCYRYSLSENKIWHVYSYLLLCCMDIGNSKTGNNYGDINTEKRHKKSLKKRRNFIAHSWWGVISTKLPMKGTKSYLLKCTVSLLILKYIRISASPGFYWCCNNLPQVLWFTTTQLFSLIILEIRSLKLISRGTFLLDTTEMNLFPWPSQLLMSDKFLGS